MSEELDKQDILYRPELEYEKNYDTSGRYSEETEYTESEEQTESLIEELLNNVEDINKIIGMLPPDIQEIVKKPLAVIEHVIGDIEHDPERLPEVEETITVENNPIPGTMPDPDDYPSSPFIEDDDDPIAITITKNNKAEVIKSEYEYDLVSIISDYLNKLDVLMNKYLRNILTHFKGIDAVSFQKILSKYSGSAANTDKDYKHLSDLVVRSQISRSMKQRMYNKMFSVDRTIAHITVCKTGTEQRIRYYNASYQPLDTTDNVISNRLLESSRATYDAKYKQNFINLYKYLNSSVIVLDECLNMFINEAQAKIILLKKEGTDLW